MPRLIAYLDMDAFYASVELLRYPDLRGRAVVIGGGREQAPVVLADGTRRYATLRHYAGRGVVTTATYEARAFGEQATTFFLDPSGNALEFKAFGDWAQVFAK